MLGAESSKSTLVSQLGYDHVAIICFMLENNDTFIRLLEATMWFVLVRYPSGFGWLLESGTV